MRERNHPPSLAGPSYEWSCSHQSTTFLLNVRHTLPVWHVHNPTRFGSIDDAWDEAFDLDGLGAVNFTQLLLPERDEIGKRSCLMVEKLCTCPVQQFQFFFLVKFWGKKSVTQFEGYFTKGNLPDLWIFLLKISAAKRFCSIKGSRPKSKDLFPKPSWLKSCTTCDTLYI